jgi:hypothetical protein
LAEIRSKVPETFEPEVEYFEARTEVLACTPTNKDNYLNAGKAIYVSFYHAYKATQSRFADFVRIERALDRFNEILCDMSTVKPEWFRPLQNTSKTRFTVTSKDTNPLQYARGHWTCSQFEKYNVESSFLALAAQLCFLEYVKAKVAAIPALLEPKQGRLSLLEAAIAILSVHDALALYYARVDELGVKKDRIHLIQYLLERTSSLYNSPFGGTIYDAVREWNTWGPDIPYDHLDWRPDILRLLKEHGYGLGEDDPAPKKALSSVISKIFKRMGSERETTSRANKADRGKGTKGRGLKGAMGKFRR